MELFGDLRINPKGWEIRSLEELTVLITDGEHATPRRVQEGIYLLSARNVLNHRIQLDDVGGDVIGRIYEYFLSKFATAVASDDGVFFTPKSLVKMIVNILEPTSGVLAEIKTPYLIQFKVA